MAADASTALAVRQKVQNFLEAGRAGNLDLFKKLAMQLDEGKGLAKTVADVKDANKRTALHFAAREGRIEVCKYLIEELKLDVDVRDEDGETPLLHASRLGQFDVAKYLLEQGADPSASSELGATALHHAAGIGNIELLNFLLSQGVDVDSQSDAGTPLIWAAGHGQQEAVKILLEHSANPNTETDDGITPLLSSVAAGSLTCLELLIQAGAKPNIMAGGATPMHVAADIGSKEIVNCLLNAGVDPNIADEDGMKPIQVAGMRGNKEVVEILLPLTSPIPNISKWSVDGVIEHMLSERSDGQANMKEPNSQSSTVVHNVKTVEVTPEAKKKSLEAKSRGEDAFRRKDYLSAIDAYTQAIDLDPNEATLLSNRSLCWLRLGQANQALTDAVACRALKPDWPKACYREGAALRLLQRYDEAANAFYEAEPVKGSVGDRRESSRPSSPASPEASYRRSSWNSDKNMVFLEVEMTWNVLIAPDKFDAKGLLLRKAIILRLMEDIANRKASKEHGYYVAVMALRTIGEGKVREMTGEVLFPVTFTCITQKPTKGEVLVGTVDKILKQGIFLKSGPLDSIFLSEKTMKDYQFSAGDNPMFLNGKHSKLEKDTMVRFKIFGLKWVESDRNFRALATLAADYLGPL
ncbi:hypothetical protein J5N97_016012 [Dioscorea zingiberensis]|uniref:Serine/threonine-protein kinase BSK1-like TPR repeats domain-containing protein n=1 Tax=Dioscorea zingiberensis TaxID=325984 RepID=A0A9D5CIX5_9LILI|nr:hypothetical protein J5N97_016012 [Dioscorea zingiberensis]